MLVTLQVRPVQHQGSLSHAHVCTTLSLISAIDSQLLARAQYCKYLFKAFKVHSHLASGTLL